MKLIICLQRMCFSHSHIMHLLITDNSGVSSADLVEYLKYYFQIEAEAVFVCDRIPVHLQLMAVV